MTVVMEERQLELEAEALGMGALRYRKEKPMPWREEAARLSELTELPPGKELIRRAVPVLAKALEEDFEKVEAGEAGYKHSAYSRITGADPWALAYIACRVCINSLSAPAMLQTILVRVGQQVCDHLQFEELAQTSPGLYEVINRKLSRTTKGKTRARILRDATRYSEVHWEEWDAHDKFRVGEFLVFRFIDYCNLMEVTDSNNTRRSTKRLTPTARTQEWLDKAHSRSELMSPVLMPMVCKPRKWSNPLNGGYLTIRRYLVKTLSAGYRDELFSIEMPEVYAALNSAQETGWRVNSRVLGVMRQVWDNGGALGKLPPREDAPLPARTWAEGEEPPEQDLKEWKAAAARIHEDNAKLYSKRVELVQKLWLAEKFEGEEAIYFPHSLDFRGRIYPMVSCLNPQGDDAAKGLLEFSEGKPLGDGGGYWLAVHIANLFGIDKVSLDERVQWVQDNEAAILDSALSPLDGERFWTTADKPYCALAACFEWFGFKAEGDEYISHLPIALDGSCSGLQHFSAMLRDAEGGSAVNLVPADKPGDIYSRVADRVEEKLQDLDDPMAAAWVGKVSRKIAKRPAMTFAYSATRFGMANQILDELKKMDVELKKEGQPPYLGGVDNYKASVFIASVVYDAIRETVVAAATAMDWLRSVARVASQDKLPIRWTTPVGLPVIQDYRQSESKRHKVYYQGRRMRLTLATATTKLDVRAQGNGIAPNYVHSLDASHLMKVLNLCTHNDIHSLALVHDSFGTHASDTDALFTILRMAFVEQYTPEVLEQFLEELKEQLPAKLIAKLPPLPAKGSLDLEAVLESDFCFA